MSRLASISAASAASVRCMRQSKRCSRLRRRPYSSAAVSPYSVRSAPIKCSSPFFSQLCLSSPCRPRFSPKKVARETLYSRGKSLIRRCSCRHYFSGVSSAICRRRRSTTPKCYESLRRRRDCVVIHQHNEGNHRSSQSIDPTCA
jgi:hypothetical protein